MKSFMKSCACGFLLALCIPMSTAGAVDMPVAIDSRIKTYIYSATDVFPVTLHYGYSMHIDLRPQETVKDIILGDNSDWSIVVKGNRIFIRANETDAHTNMTVITNKDVYEFDLFSRSAEDGIDLDMAYVIRFFYPPDEDELARVLGEAQPTAPKQDKEPYISKLISGSVNYDYRSKGEAAITPVVTFTDGQLTYFRFSGGVVPIIYAVSAHNEEKMLDVLEYGGYLVVDSTASKFVLRHKKAKVVVEKQ
jgi:type IV secretion system protein VirB9